MPKIRTRLHNVLIFKASISANLALVVLVQTFSHKVGEKSMNELPKKEYRMARIGKKFYFRLSKQAYPEGKK